MESGPLAWSRLGRKRSLASLIGGAKATSARTLGFKRKMKEILLPCRPGNPRQGCRARFYECSLPRATPHATHAPPGPYVRLISASSSLRSLLDSFFSLLRPSLTIFSLARSPLGALSDQIFIDVEPEARSRTDVGPIWGSCGSPGEGKNIDFTLGKP